MAQFPDFEDFKYSYNDTIIIKKIFSFINNLPLFFGSIYNEYQDCDELPKDIWKSKFDLINSNIKKYINSRAFLTDISYSNFSLSEPSLHTNYFNSLRELIGSLKSLKLFDDLCYKYNKSININSPKITMQEIEALLSEESLQNKSTVELIASDTFWVNKFAKYISDASLITFLIQQCPELWSSYKQLRENSNSSECNFNIELDNDKLKNLLRKYYFIRNLLASKKPFVEQTLKEMKSKGKLDDKSNYNAQIYWFKRFFTPEFRSKYLKTYKTVLEDDILLVDPYFHLMTDLYNEKEEDIKMLLFSHRSVPQMKWGVKTDDIGNSSNNTTLLYFQLPNYPLFSVHIPEKLFYVFLKEMNYYGDIQPLNFPINSITLYFPINELPLNNSSKTYYH